MTGTTLAQRFAKILLSHDKFAKADVSCRAEGTMQAIEAYARDEKLGTTDRLVLFHAIIKCCEHYNQTETIGRGANAAQWPTNRFAVAALVALDVPKPTG